MPQANTTAEVRSWEKNNQKRIERRHSILLGGRINDDGDLEIYRLDGQDMKGLVINIANPTDNPIGLHIKNSGTGASILSEGSIETSLNTDTTLPAPSAGTLTAKEYGDGAHHITVLTLTNVLVGAVAAANLGIGVQIYELPAGVQVIHAMDYTLSFDNADASCDADDPEIGIGSVVASGAVLVLNGTATFMDYMTEEASVNCDGTNGAIVGPVAATAGVLTGIALNAVGSEKSIFLNAAIGWSGTTSITVSGTITIVWDTLR